MHFKQELPMKHPRTFQLIAILALLIVPTVANADEIALGTSSDPNLIVNRGSGTLTTNALELRASTVGFNNVQVSWAWQRMAAGFDNILLQYSIDGTNFLDISPLDPPTGFGLVI